MLMILRAKICNLHDLIYISLDNGVMTTPKRRILSFVFTVFWQNNSKTIELWRYRVSCHSQAVQ